MDTMFGSMDTTDLECIRTNIAFRLPVYGRIGSRSDRGVSSLNSADVYRCGCVICGCLERGVALDFRASFRALSLLLC